jgi:hypothetical protein
MDQIGRQTDCCEADHAGVQAHPEPGEAVRTPTRECEHGPERAGDRQDRESQRQHADPDGPWAHGAELVEGTAQDQDHRPHQSAGPDDEGHHQPELPLVSGLPARRGDDVKHEQHEARDEGTLQHAPGKPQAVLAYAREKARRALEVEVLCPLRSSSGQPATSCWAAACRGSVDRDNLHTRIWRSNAFDIVSISSEENPTASFHGSGNDVCVDDQLGAGTHTRQESAYEPSKRSIRVPDA